MSSVEWFIPGVVGSVLAGLLAAGAVGRLLRTRRAIAWLLIAGIGVVLSATLTPVHDVFGTNGVGVGVCDLSRIGLAPLTDLWTLNDTSLNILLFVPLGFAIGCLTDLPRKLAVVAAALALPFAIEGIQLLAVALHRGCQTADISDNLTGLILGFAVGQGLRLGAGIAFSRRPTLESQPDLRAGRG